MSLPKQFMDEIRVRVPISDIAGKRMRLQRAGREFKGCCPFHGEKTPSFTINDQKGFYHCFGCGAHGDVINFLMEHDNLPFMDSVEQLAQLAGLQVPRQSPEEIQKYKEQDSLYDLLEATTQWFEQQLRLSSNSQALSYLTDRGLKDEIIGQFHLGYAPDNSKTLISFLTGQGFSLNQMIEAGVIRKSTRPGGDPYAFFRDRVIFPVYDLRGRVVAFGGRILPMSYGGPDTEVKSLPKYINSSESPVFQKGRLLYGLNLARENVGKGADLVVVEGYMDVIAMVQAGFYGAVAPLGTAMTETQIEQCWKVEPIDNRSTILCFDGDNAGRRAAIRAMERSLPLLKPDHFIRFSFLPAGEDPDTLIRNSGKNAFQKVLSGAQSLMDVLWAEECEGRDFSAPEAKAGLKKALLDKASQIADRSVQGFYYQEIEQRIKKSFSSYGSKGSNNKTWKSNKNWKKKNAQPEGALLPRITKVQSVSSGQSLRERILLATLINYPELFDEYAEEIGMGVFKDSNLEKIRQSLILILGQSPDFDTKSLKEALYGQGHKKTLDSLFCKTLYLHAGFAKPGQDLDIVRQGWQDIWERGLMLQAHSG